MRIIDLDQNSEAWLEWRNTGIGSSDAPSILNLSPWKTRYDLWEEKVFKYHKGKSVLSLSQMAAIRKKMKAKENQNESAKNRGKKLEPVARDKYEEWMGYKVPAVCGVHEELDFLKVSLDGWNEEKKLFTEIKCPNQKAHSDALDQKIPNYYVPQLLHQFATSDGKKCHYVSFHPTNPPGQRLAIVHVDATTAQSTLGIEHTLADQIVFVKYALAMFWDCVVKAEYKDLED